MTIKVFPSNLTLFPIDLSLPYCLIDVSTWMFTNTPSSVWNMVLHFYDTIHSPGVTQLESQKTLFLS